MTEDVASPIDFRNQTEAREWERTAEERPGRSEILGRMADEVARRARHGRRILELGSGPGFLARRLLERINDLEYTALDFSPAMHELARERLGPHATRVTFVERTFRSDDWTDGLGPFDLVVTNQAVHELRHKRHAPVLHRQVHAVMAFTGSYIVSDHFSDPGGLTNADLYMTRDEQKAALENAGFSTVRRIAVAGTLVLHVAEKEG